MKALIIVFACLCAPVVLRAQVPISITSVNMPVINDTARYSVANLNSIGDYTITGANYVWDFSMLDSTDQQIRKFQPSLQTPYGFYFFPPKYGEKILDSFPIPGGLGFSVKNIYSFYKKNGTISFNSEGLGLTMNGIPVGATYSDEDELYSFPLDYTDRDSTTFKLSTPSNTMIPFSYKKQGYRITEADGWGTITTPYGTAACLRVVTTQYSIDTITIAALPSPFNKVGFPNYTRSYQWLTLGEKIPYLEVLGNLVGANFIPTQAKYRDTKRNFVGMKEEENHFTFSVFPNPSCSELTVLLSQNESPVIAEITDLQGKNIKTQVLENNRSMINTHQLNVSNVAGGLYFLNLITNTGKQSIKISIQ